MNVEYIDSKASPASSLTAYGADAVPRPGDHVRIDSLLFKAARVVWVPAEDRVEVHLVSLFG